MEILTAGPWQMWAAFAVIGGAIAAYVSERFTIELVSLAVVVAFLLLFHAAPLADDQGNALVDTASLLRGFADPALVAVLCLLVLSQGLLQSGAMELPTRYLLAGFRSRPRAIINGVFLIALFTSAILNDTPVVVMFMPIVAALAAAGGIPASKLMMPLSFVALLGGMTTLIGSSTNILAAGAFERLTGERIGFFDLTALGAVISVAGVAYLATVGRALLPRRESSDPLHVRDQKQFLAQLEIDRTHFLAGRKPVAGFVPDLPDVTIRLVQRREEAFLPPFDDYRFEPGDVAIVAATRSALTDLLKRHPEVLENVMAEIPIAAPEGSRRLSQMSLVEAIVAPGSRLAGRTIAQIGFHYQTNCVIVGIERRSRMLRGAMNAIRLEPGDVLLISGKDEDIQALRADRDLLLLEWSKTAIPKAVNAHRAALIFLTVVAASATGLAPISIAALTGALAMLGLGILNIRQASRAFDRRVYLLIGASIAMGHVLEATGGAALIGGMIAPVGTAYGPAVLLSATFAITAVLTNLLSNNATALLLMPIATNAAVAAGIDPLPLALTVIFGANCPFATPIGYQTNLLVMTPGRYRFGDYFRVGGPLVVLVWIVYSLAAPIYFSRLGLL